MGEIKAELNAELQTHIAFEIPLFGGIPVPESAVVSWVIIAVLTLLAVWLTHGLRKRPGRRQAAAEMLVGFIYGFCRDTLGDKYWRAFAPYLGTVGLYLALANMAGLFGVTPPTKDLNVTAGLAIMSALLIYGAQFRFHGLRGGRGRHAAQHHGDRHPAAVAVHATVRQHLRRLRHHGAGQDGRSGRCAHPAEPVFRCVRRHDTGSRIRLSDDAFPVGIA